MLSEIALMRYEDSEKLTVLIPTQPISYLPYCFEFCSESSGKDSSRGEENAAKIYLQ
jgi:hypothetical protein